MIITINDDSYLDTRIDSFLADYFEDYSRSKLSKLIKQGLVKVNNKPVKTSYLLKSLDQIELSLKDLEIKAIEKENIYINVIYEDEDIAIIDKPVAMLSHPTSTVRSNTLVNALLNRFDSLSDINGQDRLGIVHRLDFNTSGLMIIAKTNRAGEELIGMFKNRTITKKYRAICIGNFAEKEGVLEYPIGRNLANRKLMTVDSLNGKYAKTSFKLIWETKGYSYLHLDLYTGRTHQIRVHLAHINRPILGDRDYGGKRPEFSIDHQLLQSFYLEFDHPISKKHLRFQIDESSQIKKYADLLFKERSCTQELKA
ncbi:MAG: RluA family pseudouridine synthase [Tissierellia bacterium]|nr:RluA family pseudouridine synthase [Tissierellia bacterium]